MIPMRQDPLAGDVVMDATARLLSPKGAAPEKHREEPPRQQRREGTPKRECREAPKKESRRQEPPRRSAAKPTKPARDDRRPQRQRRGRGPMEVTLHLGSQKDSTEQQGSLMKPYYFNPDED